MSLKANLVDAGTGKDSLVRGSRAADSGIVVLLTCSDSWENMFVAGAGGVSADPVFIPSGGRGIVSNYPLNGGFRIHMLRTVQTFHDVRRSGCFDADSRRGKSIQ